MIKPICLWCRRGVPRAVPVDAGAGRGRGRRGRARPRGGGVRAVPVPAARALRAAALPARAQGGLAHARLALLQVTYIISYSRRDQDAKW